MTDITLPKLRPQIKQFADYIFAGKHPHEAAKSAGYSPHTLKDVCWRLQKRPDVKKYLELKREQLAKQSQIDAERITKELAAMSFFDIRELFDDQGNVKPVKELDDSISKAVANIDVVETRKGEDVVDVQYKVRLVDKNVSIKQLREHLGLVEPEGNEKPLNLQVNFVGSKEGTKANEVMQRTSVEASELPESKDVLDVTTPTGTDIADAQRVPNEKHEEGTPTPQEDGPGKTGAVPPL